MTENQEKIKELCERYPFLIPRNVWTDEIDEDWNYSYTIGVEIPKGWYKLFLQMCEDIRQPLIDANYLDKFRIMQLKEKYNTLRCYTNGSPKEVDRIISKYEHVSRYVCTVCGKPAKYETDGYIASYCEDCIKHELADSTEKLEFDPIMKIIKFSNGKTETLEFDCSDIWRRLYETDSKVEQM